jgi:quinol monooxygenase YgiN
MDDVLTLVVHIRARQGKEAELRQALKDLLAPTREEEGCVNYDLYAGRDDPGLFVMLENWRSAQLWQRHMEAPHLHRFKARADVLVADWTLQQLRRIG